MPPYIFNHHLNSWPNKQNRERPVHDIGHTNVGSSARPTFQVRHANHQHGRTHLLEVKHVLAEHEVSIIRKIKDNSVLILGVIQRFIKSPTPLVLIGLLLLLIFDCLTLSSLVEKIVGALESM